MAAIRRPEKAPVKPKPKPVRYVPLHQQILGKNQIELDSVEDLRERLEVIYGRDEIEFDVYQACHDALDLREAKAKEGLLKATGRFVKPVKVVEIPVKRVEHKPWKTWQVKLFIVFCLFVFYKIMTFSA